MIFALLLSKKNLMTITSTKTTAIDTISAIMSERFSILKPLIPNVNIRIMSSIDRSWITSHTIICFTVSSRFEYMTMPGIIPSAPSIIGTRKAE